MSSSRLPQSPGGPPRKQVTKTIASLITQCNLERRPPPAQPLTAAELQEEVHEAKERSKVPMDQESLKRWMAFTDEDVENARRKDIEQSADDLVNAFLNPHGSSHAGRVMLPPPQPQPQPQPQPPQQQQTHKAASSGDITSLPPVHAPTLTSANRLRPKPAQNRRLPTQNISPRKRSFSQASSDDDDASSDDDAMVVRAPAPAPLRSSSSKYAKVTESPVVPKATTRVDLPPPTTASAATLSPAAAAVLSPSSERKPFRFAPAPPKFVPSPTTKLSTATTVPVAASSSSAAATSSIQKLQTVKPVPALSSPSTATPKQQSSLLSSSSSAAASTPPAASTAASTALKPQPLKPSHLSSFSTPSPSSSPAPKPQPVKPSMLSSSSSASAAAATALGSAAPKLQHSAPPPQTQQQQPIPLVPIMPNAELAEVERLTKLLAQHGRSHADEMTRMQRQLHDAQHRGTDLVGKLDEVRRGTESDVKRWASERQQLERQLNDALRANEDLATKAQQYEAKQQQLERERQQWATDRQRLEQQLAEAQRSTQKTQADGQRALADSQRAHAEALARVQKQLGDAQLDWAVERQDLVARKKPGRSSADWDQHAAQHAALRAQNADLQARFDQLSQQMIAQRAQATADLQRLRERNAVLEDQARAHEGNMDTIQNENKGLVATYQTEINTLRRQLAEQQAMTPRRNPARDDRLRESIAEINNLATSIGSIADKISTPQSTRKAKPVSKRVDK